MVQRSDAVPILPRSCLRVSGGAVLACTASRPSRPQRLSNAELLDHLSVPADRTRSRPAAPPTGSAATRPTSPAHRELLRRRGITATTPNPLTRSPTGNDAGPAVARGGRPPAFDPTDYKNPNHVERWVNHGKQ
jgi:hypothetical protein